MILRMDFIKSKFEVEEFIQRSSQNRERNNLMLIELVAFFESIASIKNRDFGKLRQVQLFS